MRPVFKALAGELGEVSVEGWRAWLLNGSLAEIKAAELKPEVNLLPFFDPYTIAIARHSEHLLDETHRSRVYRAQGRIAPVVLVSIIRSGRSLLFLSSSIAARSTSPRIQVQKGDLLTFAILYHMLG